MTVKQIENMGKLDKAAEEAGGFVSQCLNSDTHYDYRKLLKYCEENNKEPLDLTIREVQKFILPN